MPGAPSVLPTDYCLLRGDVWLQTRAALVEGDAGGDLFGQTLPAVGRMAEGLSVSPREGRCLGLPDAALDLYVRVLETDDVEGVGLAASARRGGRARLHEERGVALNLIALGGA